MTAKVGGSSIGSSITLTKGTSPTLPYEFSGNVTGSSVTLNVTRSSSCTFWLKKVVITYTTSGGGGGDDPEQLSAPTGLAASNETTSSIDLSWNAVSNASSYTVSYTPTGGTEQTVTSLTGTSTTLSNLTAGTTYSIKIKAVGDGSSYSDSGYSTAITASTTSSGGGGGSEYFDGTNSTDFILVNNASLLQAGDEVIVVNKAGEYAMQLRTTANQVDVAASVSNNIATSATATVLTLGGSSSGWSLSGDINGDTYYLHTTSDATGGLSTKTSADTGWSISISSDESDSDYAAITYSNNTRSIGYNSGAGAGSRFRLYAASNSQYRVKLYARRPVSKDPLGTPDNVAIAAPSTVGSLSLSWGTVTNATGYTISYTAAGGSEQTTTSATNSATLTGLTGNTSYTVKVKATDSSDTYSDSEWSSSATELTLPGAPTGLTGGSATSEGFTASWTAPAGGAASYTVEVYKSSDTSTAVATQTDATSPLTITGLESNTAYKFKVTATNASGSTASELSGEISTAAGNLYILGNVNGAAGFAPNEGVLMDYDSGMYSKTVYFTGTDNYFAFTTKLASQGGDAGWSEINGASRYRRGAKSADWAPFLITASDPGNDMGGTDSHGTYNWLSDQSNHNNGEWSYNIARGLYLIEQQDFKMYVTPLPLTTTVTIPAATLKAKKLTAEWTAQANATKYLVSISPAPTGWSDQEVTATSYEFTDLTAETQYTVTVTPYYNSFAGTAATATATTAAAAVGDFVLLTNASDLSAGDEVMFVYASSATAGKALTPTTGSNHQASTDVVISDGAIAADGNEGLIFTVAKNGNNYQFIRDENYLFWSSSTTIGYGEPSSVDNKCDWGVTVDSNDYHASVLNSNSSRYIRYYTTGTFRAYTSETQASTENIKIYYRTTSAKTPLTKPTNLTAATVTAHTVTLTWDAVEHADSYQVTIEGTGSYPAATNSVTIEGLNDGTQYTATVVAIGSGSYSNSPASDGATFTTTQIARVTYNKVTAEMLAEGDADAYQYIFVAPIDAAVMGGNDEDARVGITEDVIIDSENDQAKVPTGAAISLFTIEKDGTSYYFYDGTYYLATQSGVKLFSITDKNDATYVATWNIDAANSLITTTHSSGKAIRFNYASNYFKFRLYDTTGQHEAWLYRSTTKIALTAPEIKGVEDGGEYRFANITIGVPTSATSVEYTLTPAGGTATSGTITAETTLPALVAGEGTVAYTLTATALRGSETATTTISFTLNADGESMATIDIPLNASTNAWGNNKKYTEAVSYLAEAADDDVKATIVTTNGDANSGRYFTSNQSWRVYKKGGSLTLSVAPGLQITKAEFVYAEENGASIVAENIAVSAGTYDATTHMWANTGATRDLRTVTFSPDGRTDYKYINVYYTTSATTAIINAPTIHFSDDSDVPATGKYTETQSVKFAAHGTSVNANESLQLWYTTDGSDPRSSSTRTQYTSGTVAITQTTDVRVAATFIGADWSAVTTANLALKPAKATISPVTNTRRQAEATGAVTLDVEANGMTNIWLYYTISNDLESNLDPNVKANTSTTTGRVLYDGSPVTISSAWWNENTIIRVRATTDGDGTDDEFPSTFSDLTTAKHYVVSDEFDATAATNVGRTAFTANWEALANATGYVLEVYSVKPGPTSGDYTLLNETFDSNGHANEGVGGRDSHFNFSGITPTPTPIKEILTDVTGWEFDESSDQTISRAAYECVLVGSGNHGGSAETPALTIPAGTTSLTLTFNVAGYDGTNESQTGIKLSTDMGSIGSAGSTEYIADVTVNKGAWTATPASYEIYPEGTSGGVTIYNSGANSRFFLDDVKVVAHVTGSGEGTPVTGSPFSINDGDAMSFVVTGLQPNTTYWYRVKGLQNAVEVNCTNWNELVEVTTAQYATLGEEVATGYIDVPVNIAYVDDNGIAYGCASKGEHQITDGNATEYTEEDDYYSDKLEDYDQRDWVALDGLTSPSTLVGKTIVNFAGTQDATKPGYYFNVTTQPAEADITDQSGNDVIAENTYQVRNLIADNGDYNYVRPQIYEYTTKFNAGLKKDGNTWVVIGSTNAGVETIVLDTSLKTPTDEDVTADGEYRDLEGVFVVVEGSRHAPLRSGSADLNNQSYQFLITKVSEVVTGVQTLKTDDVEYRLRGIYNLQGQRVRETVPGQFYIINGKKTMVNSVIRDTDF